METVARGTTAEVVATGVDVGTGAATSDETAEDAPRAKTDQEADPMAEGALMALQEVKTGDPATSDLAANEPGHQPVRRPGDYALEGLIEMQC